MLTLSVDRFHHPFQDHDGLSSPSERWSVENIKHRNLKNENNVNLIFSLLIPRKYQVAKYQYTKLLVQCRKYGANQIQW